MVMKFGKQLELGVFQPWVEHYICYARLKRIIHRLRFLEDLKLADGGLATKTMARNSSSFVQNYGAATSDESTNTTVEMAIIATVEKSLQDKELSISSPRSHSGDGREDGCALLAKELSNSAQEGEEFFAVIAGEIDKINEFFIGKLSQIRVDLENLMDRRGDSFLLHHSSSGAGRLNDVIKLRDLYIELVALRSYTELNRTGFYKIIKKYDKVLEKLPKSLPTWEAIVDKQPFCSSLEEQKRLMRTVTVIVSRDKLIEWELYAMNKHNQSKDAIFPSVRFTGLAISIVVFLASIAFPYSTDRCVSHCFSITAFVISLWVSEALPYFATAMLVPPLVIYMDVLRDEVDVNIPMPRNEAADLVMSSMFNHTSMLLLGGYAISSAISRCKIELKIASLMVDWLGNRPQAFILAIMFLGLFLSMWISNHTAPILCSTIIYPIVKDLPSDARFSKALVLGLAFACKL